MKAPKIRFKGFEGDWEEFKVKNIFKITRWYVLATNKTEIEQTQENQYPVYSSQTKNKGLMWFYKEFLYENAITRTTDWANAGTVNFRNWKFYCTNVCWVLLSNNFKANTAIAESLNKIAKNYVSYVWNPKLMNNVMAEISITIPKKQEEQEKIWSLFEQLDSHISKNQQKLEKLKNMKQAFLQKLFPKDWSTFPELRFKGFEGAWEESELDKKAVFWKGNWYSKNDLTEEWNKIVLYGRLYTKYETIIKDVDTFCFKKENSILSKWWELVVPASWETAEDIARASVINQKGIILWWDLNIIYPTSEINSVFLALNITYWIPHNDMAKRAQWKSVVHIRNSDLWKIILNYPKVKEQEKIWAFFEKLDTQITQQTQKIQKLQNLKQSLLEKMFI